MISVVRYVINIVIYCVITSWLLIGWLPRKVRLSFLNSTTSILLKNLLSTKKSQTCRRPARSISTCRDRSILSETRSPTFLVYDLSATCRRPAQNMSETWFWAGFEQDRCNGIWALLESYMKCTCSTAECKKVFRYMNVIISVRCSALSVTFTCLLLMFIKLRGPRWNSWDPTICAKTWRESRINYSSVCDNNNNTYII